MTAGGARVWRIALGRLARRAWRHRQWLLRAHAGVAALAVAIVFLLPRWYAASVSLVPAPKDGLALDLTGTGALLAGAPLGLGAAPTPQDQLRMVLRSRAVADSLVARFRLRERWRLRRREQAREKLAEHTTFTSPREGNVVVEVEAREPALARDLAAAYAHFGASESIRLRSSLAAQRRVYLESRLADLDREIAAAGERLRRFEEEHGAVSLPDQARETFDAYGTLRAQVVLLETELAAAHRYFTEQSPEVRALRDRIAELERQIGKLAHQGGPLLPRGDALPSLRQRYLELGREQASLVAVAELLRRVYEQARVEEANPVPAFSVLDAPELPERHARPHRGLTVALALMLCTAASLGRLWWTDPATAEGETPAGAEPARRAA